MKNAPSDTRPAYEVQVCVHNSPDDVRRCLASVQSTLAPFDRLLIVDDGSDEPARTVCEEAAKRDGRTRLIRRPEGSGFCRAANAGLRARSEDRVIILNSDTVVTGDWIDRIDRCFSAYPDVGLVGPLSNAGGWQSIPEFATGGPAQNDVRDDDTTLAAISAYCATFRQRFDIPLVEQLNGFCFAVRGNVLESVGLFDEDRFPRGYGEEVDFMFRASEAGFLRAVAADCFVYHAKTKSYSRAQRSEYVRAGREQLLSLYGRERIERANRSTRHHPILAAIRADARQTFVREGWLAGGSPRDGSLDPTRS